MKIKTVLRKIFLLLILFFVSTNGFVIRNVNAFDKINYRLKWLYNTSVVGDLYALDMGFFKGAGLLVDVKAGGPERDAIRELELGRAQFGVASADQVIRAMSKGAPVIVIAQFFQENPMQFVYRKKNGPINNISDLVGKTIGITYGGNDETIMRTILLKGGIDEKKVTFFSVRYDYTPFYMGKVDVWPVYRNAQGIIIDEKLSKNGEDVQFFNPSDHGIRFVANSLVTSKKMMKEKPIIVKKFVTALLSGWNESLDFSNEEKTLRVLKKFDRDTPLTIRKKQLKITRDLIIPDKNKKLGSIDIESWKETEDIMLKQKLINKPVFVEKVLIQQGL